MDTHPASAVRAHINGGGGEKAKPTKRSEGQQKDGGTCAPDHVPLQGETLPHMPSFGGGPSTPARSDLCTEGCTATRPAVGARWPTWPLSRDETCSRPGAQWSDPADACSPFIAPQTRGMPPHRPRSQLSPAVLQCPRCHTVTTAPPAHPRVGLLLPEGENLIEALLHRARGGRCQDPSRHGKCSRLASQQDPPLRRLHSLDCGCCFALSMPFLQTHTRWQTYGAEVRGNTRSPHFHSGTQQGSAPTAACTPAFGPHTAGKSNGEVTGRAWAGTTTGNGRHLLSDHPPGGHSPSGDAATRHRVNRTRRSSGDAGTTECSPRLESSQARAGWWPAPPVPSRRRPSREEVQSCPMQYHMPDCSSSQGERAQWALVAATPQLGRAESTCPLLASPVSRRATWSALWPVVLHGVSAKTRLQRFGAGCPSPAWHGCPQRVGTWWDATDTSQQGWLQQTPPQGIDGSSSPTLSGAAPLPGTRCCHHHCYGGGEGGCAPPKSLNLCPARQPFRLPTSI